MLPFEEQIYMHLSQRNFIGFNYVFYTCPQLMNDVDCKLFGACDFGRAEIKEEYSLDYSDCIKNEGNIVHLS